MRKILLIFYLLILLNGCGITFKEYVRWTLDSADVYWVNSYDVKTNKTETKMVVITDYEKSKIKEEK